MCFASIAAAKNLYTPGIRDTYRACPAGAHRGKSERNVARPAEYFSWRASCYRDLQEGILQFVSVRKGTSRPVVVVSRSDRYSNQDKVSTRMIGKPRPSD